jgi:hypothetical protein
VASTRQVNSTVEYSGIHMVNLSWCVIKNKLQRKKKKRRLLKRGSGGLAGGGGK